jgi:hypothetical protein
MSNVYLDRETCWDCGAEGHIDTMMEVTAPPERILYICEDCQDDRVTEACRA